MKVNKTYGECKLSVETYLYLKAADGRNIADIDDRKKVKLAIAEGSDITELTEQLSTVDTLDRLAKFSEDMAEAVNELKSNPLALLADSLRTIHARRMGLVIESAESEAGRAEQRKAFEAWKASHASEIAEEKARRAAGKVATGEADTL